MWRLAFAFSPRYRTDLPHNQEHTVFLLTSCFANRRGWLTAWYVETPWPNGWSRWTPDWAVLVRTLRARGNCVVFRTLYSHTASLHPSVLMRTGEFSAICDPAMNQQNPPTCRGEWKYTWSLHAVETGISSGWMGHWHDADFTWLATQACETVDFNAAIFIPHRFFQIHWVTCLWLTTCLLPLMLFCGCRCTTPTQGIRDSSLAIVPIMTWH